MSFKISKCHVLIVFALACLVWLAHHQTTLADSSLPSALTLTPITDVHAGDTITVSARLTDVAGTPNRPLADALLVIHFNSAPFRQVRTDEHGGATVTVREPVSGTFHVEVFYAGDSATLPSYASTTFTVLPAVLDIQTVPAISGVELSVGNQTFRSDASGRIRIEQPVAGDFALHLITATLESTGSRAVFSRWSDNTFSSDRSVTISSSSQLQLGFEQSALVALQYSSPDGSPVSFERISNVIVKSSTGITHSYPSDVPHWLEANRIVRRQSGLESVPLQWGIDRVDISGSNVVNQDQQRFVPKPNDQWNVQLLIFTGSFTAHDAVFGFPLGREFEVTYPDGSKHVLPIDGDGHLTLDSLARGTYFVHVIGAPGIAARSPVDVSRDQAVNVMVLSYVDIGCGLGLAILAAAWLLLIGRPTILRAVGIQRPVFSDRRILVRSGVTVLAVMLALLVTFDAQVQGDNLPILPDLSAASAQQTRSNGVAASLPPLTDFATSRPTSTPTPAPQATPASSVESMAHSSTVAQYTVSPIFASFWNDNGGLSTFGYPIGDVFTVDAAHGVVAQLFEKQLLEQHPQQGGTPYEIELSRIGVQYAAQHGLLATTDFQPVAHSSAQQSSDCVYFALTQHDVCDAFLSYWQHHGLDFGDPGTSFRESLALLGYPVSEPFVDPETGLTVQYFERARLEFHPENPEGRAVILSNLEADIP